MEYMVRPENIARLTVTHKPTMFKYKDLVDDRRFLSVCVGGGMKDLCGTAGKLTFWHVPRFCRRCSAAPGTD